MRLSHMVGEKRRWRQYKTRTRRLPENYRTAIEAVQRYLMYAGGVGDGESVLAMFEDLADLFEQSAADGIPIRDIVGEDPVQFMDEFIRNYPKGQWITREQDRLTRDIARAAGEDTEEQEELP